MRPVIAVLWCSHLRTAFKGVYNQLKNFFDPNAGKYEFHHYIHTYDVISATGWSTQARWANPAADVRFSQEYLDAVSRVLNPVVTYCGPTHDDDEQLASRTIASTKGSGNLPASTYQFLKRSRAWKDFFRDEPSRASYSGFVVTRFDNTMKHVITLPDPGALTPSTYYAAWQDRRKQFVDDRFALVALPCDSFMSSWGEQACRFTDAQNGHFFPESANDFAIRQANMRVSYLTKDSNDPLSIARFQDVDAVEIERFIEYTKR